LRATSSSRGEEKADATDEAEQAVKLATILFNGETVAAALRDDGQVVSLANALGGLTLKTALANNFNFAAVDLRDASVVEGELTFLPPIPDPRRILCAGFNYRDHAAEASAKLSDWPTFFVRFPSSVVGHDSSIVRPGASALLDWEGELAVVIGRGGRAISPANAMAHVAGYSCFGDHSVRDFQLHGTQATAGKNFDSTGAWGPWLVTQDEIPDPGALALRTLVNGIIVQQANTSDLIFDIPALIAYISTFTTLETGDVIATGTPAGIGGRMMPPRFLKPGEVVSIEIDGVGTLSNPVIEESA
jgi:2-keto-4-pentenoate hydratase/2-oxohepta-3-ene-1,7-dioic acid hydratase in catechol pathway